MEYKTGEIRKMDENVNDLRIIKRLLFRKLKFPEIAGSIHSELVKCGKKSCKCNKGNLHGPYFYLYRYEGGKLKRSYICPVNKISKKYREIQQGIENMNHNKIGRREIANLNNQILEFELKKIKRQDYYLEKKMGSKF